MNKKLILAVLYLSGMLLVFLVLGPEQISGKNNTSASVYDSDINMKKSISEMQAVIKSMYSDSKYKNVKVVTSYQSFGVLCNNLSQERLKNLWNTANPTKKVSWVCGIVANTMLLRKYMTLASGKLSNSYTAETIFNMEMKYAWGSGKIFSSEDTSGTTQNEEVKLLNYFLDTYESSKYTANGDITGLWGTCRNYPDERIRPIILDLNGNESDHAVLCTACYIEQVTYKTTTLGITISHTDSYKIARVCNGWEDSTDSGWNNSTNSYIFFDCVRDLIKLK